MTRIQKQSLEVVCELSPRVDGIEDLVESEVQLEVDHEHTELDLGQPVYVSARNRQAHMEDMQHAMSVPSITAKSNRTSGGYDWDHDFTVVYLCHVVIVEFVRGALHLLHRQIVQHYTTETAFAVQVL